LSRTDFQSSRVPPEIRDHETIRMIGRGAYGEVWMARSVTGALRAVKVVWREDYDHPESFEREFEALKKYEPVSRRHPGLVPILQVGRSDREGFYYYVMELADDLERGRDIDPATYRSHTLAAQMKRDGRISAEECIKLGANVAEGLDYLHRNKLIHRDVKPSNLVFVEGQCSLADIGLVALLGQRSFVGTEGFVAPEGPGTAASDIFSIGMVLYEASTGKDRLDFPDIPSSRETGERLETWRRLNRVICKACAPRAKDRYDTAMEMSLDLRGQPLPSSRKRAWYALAAVSALAITAVGFGMWIARERGAGGVFSVQKAPPLLTLDSTPAGATVFSGEDKLGVTPLTLDPPEGVPVIYQLRLPGYKFLEVEHTATGGKPVAYDMKLELSRLPQTGERWDNSIGILFNPRQGAHISARPVEMSHFRRFVEGTGRSFEGKVVRYQTAQEKEASYIVVVPPRDADAFRYWITERDRQSGYLSQEHHYEVEPFYFVENPSTPEDMPEGRETASDADGKDWQAFYLRVERQTYGTVVIKSSPPGMKIFQHEEFLGVTPHELERVRSGPVEYELRGEGFTDVLLDGEVRAGEILDLYANMDERTGVIYGREWKNSLGMKFMPLGDVLMAAWETRRRDYLEFAKRTNARRPPPIEPGDGKMGTLPIVGVDLAEARAFCDWLTKHERASGVLGPDDAYRLPTDEEWSRAVGLPLERGETPADRNGRIRGIYPWGFEWPPPAHVDNFADASGARQAGLDNFIADHDDKMPFTAPVASLRENERGLAGLAGNVSEWVDTDYDKQLAPASTAAPQPLGTVRGGNWRSAAQEELLASNRIPVPADTRRNTIGFRIVLSPKTH
jgi:serine/threonine protein kinase